MQSVKVLQQVLQNLKSIAINIAKFQKYYNKYCKSSKVLQYLLQNAQSIAINIPKSQSITILCTTIGTIPDCNTYCKISKYCKNYWNIFKALERVL